MSIIESSNYLKEFAKHWETVSRGLNMQEGFSFAVPKDGLKAALLRRCAARLSVGSLTFVVFEHESVFEVARLPDGSSAKDFYETYGVKIDNKVVEQTEEENELDRCVAILTTYARQYLNNTVEESKKYDDKVSEKMISGKVVSYGYLQRRCVSVSAFRRYSQGATKGIRNALQAMVERGILQPVSKSTAETHFGTYGELFYIMKVENETETETA